jgi:hypothetical protein
VFDATSPGTHKDQGGVQILAIFFEKFLVVLLGHLVIAFIESSLGIFSG